MVETEGPTCDMEYLGLTIDTREMTVKIPDNKMKELLVLIREVAFSKKVTLKKLQSWQKRNHQDNDLNFLSSTLSL
jgi:RNA polymerase-interacting CarD/CdnL/TRCF family regulator